MELRVYGTVWGLLESEGKNVEDRSLFARMKNRGEVFEVELVVDGEERGKTYMKAKDIEDMYIMSLLEKGERLKLCIEAMRVEYEKRCMEKKELLEQIKWNSANGVKKEKAVSLYDDNRESKIVVWE